MGPKKQKASKKMVRKFDKNGRKCCKLNSTLKSGISIRNLPCSNYSERFLNLELYVSVFTSFKNETHYLDAKKCKTLYEEFESATSKDESSAAEFSLTDQVTTSESHQNKSTRGTEIHLFSEDTSVPLSANEEFLVYGKSKSSKYVYNLNAKFFRYVIASMKDKLGFFNDGRIKVNILSKYSLKNSLFINFKQELEPLCQETCSGNSECLNDASNDSASLNTTGVCESSVKLQCSNDSIIGSLYHGKSEVCESTPANSPSELARTNVGIIGSFPQGTAQISESTAVKTRDELESYHDTTECCESTVFKTVGEIACTNVKLTESFSQSTAEFSESTAVKTRDELQYLNDERIVSIFEDSSESVVAGNSRKVEASHCPTKNLFAPLTDCLSKSSSSDETSYILTKILISKDSEPKFEAVKPADHIDFSESSVVFKSRDELIYLNDDTIVSLCDDSNYSPESTVVNSPRNVGSLNCGTNSSTTPLITVENNPLNPFSANSNNKLNYFLVPKDNGPKILTSKSADTNKSMSTDLSSPKELSFDSDSCEYKVILKVLIHRKMKLREILKNERTDYIEFLNSLQSMVIYSTKTESSYVRKSKRNACIQSIYKKNREYKIECLQKILSQTNKMVRLLHDSYRIQLIKLEEVLDKVDLYKSNFDICGLDENWKFLVLNTLRKLNKMDEITARRWSEENQILSNLYVTFLKHISF